MQMHTFINLIKQMGSTYKFTSFAEYYKKYYTLNIVARYVHR